MTPSSPATPARPRAGAQLHGHEAVVGQQVLHLYRQTQRERLAAAPSLLEHLRAVAADPQIYELAAQVTVLAEGERSVRRGGRPSRFDDWVLVLYGSCIPVTGSSAKTARTVADLTVWNLMLDQSAAILGEEVVSRYRQTPPTRDNWNYFLKTRFAPFHVQLVARSRQPLLNRANELGLLRTRSRGTNIARENVISIDGKVMSSPLRTTEPYRVNKVTGEITPIRQDSGRSLYGEAGEEGIAWGNKFAIASTRSSLANLRVIVGLARIAPEGVGGEAGVFTDLVTDLGRRTDGIHAITVDGAVRGTHIAAIQAATGAAVVSPTRRKDKKHGGITIGKYSYAATRLPEHRSHKAWTCKGHDLWAAGGTIWERTLLANGTENYTEVERVRTKHESKTSKSGTRHQINALYRLPCKACGTHEWWERLTTTEQDTEVGFNRSEYLRLIPEHHPQFAAVYPMRADTESLNRQLEYAFHGHRLPAWGTPNQTIVMLMAALAHNAWARHTWQREIAKQSGAPPGTSAA